MRIKSNESLLLLSNNLKLATRNVKSNGYLNTTVIGVSTWKKECWEK